MVDLTWLVGGAAVVAVVIVAWMASRRGPRVIDTPGAGAGASSDDAAPAGAAGTWSYVGDVLAERGADGFLEAGGDAIEKAVFDEFGDLSEQPGASTMIADAAEVAIPAILADGRATVDLPALPTPVGPRSFRREFDLPWLERSVIDIGCIDTREFLEWRGADRRVVAIGAWLDWRIREETGQWTAGRTDLVLSLAGAARTAVAQVDSGAAARVEFTGLVADPDKPAFDLACDIDSVTVDAAVRALDAPVRGGER
ncbi:MAG: hypothetical protein IPK81_09695 [Rhodospirillales bacterium]|nr:MAG: hypothetical protein IPK81_09695 [Rhodospirillales bacterium]